MLVEGTVEAGLDTFEDIPAIAFGGTQFITAWVDNRNGNLDIYGRIIESSSAGGTTLTVSKPGTGSGTVTSNPTGINCGVDCTKDYPMGTVVTLTATSDTGSTFTGWSGDADCSDDGTGNIATVTMNSAVSCTATFILNTYTLTITTAGTGSGVITPSPPGIFCGIGCYEYDHGTGVMLTVTAAPGSTFGGWSGTDGARTTGKNKLFLF